jgi:hypothetical protein
MIRIKIKLPATEEFYAEFTDELHLDQLRKFLTILCPGDALMNGINLRPRVTLKEILEPNSLQDS